MSGAAPNPSPVGVLRVVAADRVGPPVQAVVGGAALEEAVHAARVLVLRAPVVDHDVRHALHTPAWNAATRDLSCVPP
jgi:hypothetical protein